METNNPSSQPLPTSIFSADAAGRLEQAIKYMVTTFLEEGLVERNEVVSILEDMVLMLEQRPNVPETETKRVLH